MAESASFARRGFVGSAAEAHLASSITSGATSITVDDASTWATIATNGPFRFTINRGGSNEEECEATGVSTNTLTGVTRGVGGTTASSHDSGESVEHTSSVRDADEANYWVAKLAAAIGAADTFVYGDADNSVAGTAVPASRFIGKKATGGLGPMTAAEAKAILALASTDISDFGEAARDTLGTALTAGAYVTITPNDGADTITIAGDSAALAELIRDTIGTALTAGAGVTITPNDGADTITIAGSVSTLCAVKSTDESVTSSTTLQNDDELSLSVAANTDYAFTLWAYVVEGSAGGDGGFKAQFSAPAGASLVYSVFVGSDTAINDVSASFTATNVLDNSTVFTVTASQITAYLFKGSIRVGATAGTLTFQWAQSSSNATATTVKAGSTLTAIKEG